jgi:hypothetical protein
VKIRLTLDIDAEAQRGLARRDGIRYANRALIVAEIQALWTAHLDDLRGECAKEPK